MTFDFFADGWKNFWVDNSMQLTVDQQQAIRCGQPVRFTDPQTQLDCVVVRADLYEQVEEAMQGGDFDVRQMYPHLARTFGPAGWDDPAMEIYAGLDPRRT